MKAEWLEIAKNLPCGGKVKVHCCGNSPSMLISHRENGYSTHCFRCNDPESHDFVSHGQRSIADIMRHRSELAEYRGKPPRFPSDYTKEIPVQYAWFLKYGIPMAVAARYHFGWSEFFNRIVMPIYKNNEELVAVHMRSVDPNDKPKYINLGTPEKDLLFWADYTGSDILVITEDILSAIKVNLAGYNAVALNGSDITDIQAYRIYEWCNKNGATPVVWLDNDPAGHKGAKECIKQLSMAGCRLVMRVQSEADPKTYNREQINALMKEAR